MPAPQVAAQEARLGEAEVHALAQRTDGDPGAHALAAAPEVPLGDAQVEDELVDRRIAGAERQFARGLLLDLHLQARAVRSRARHFVDGRRP